MNAPPRPSRRAGLFQRIFLTFVLTVVASAIVAGVGAYAFASRYSSDWVADTLEVLEAHEPDLLAALHDPQALAERVQALSDALGHDVAVYRRHDGLVAGRGPRRPPPGVRERHRELRSGQPVVLRSGPLQPPGIAWGLSGGDAGGPAMLVVSPRPGRRLGVAGLSVVLLVAVLGAGAWVLSRSLTRRIARLEASAGRIAAGELRHRVALDDPIPRDEIDELGLAFNEMAEKVEQLVAGHKTLLANVSHELRTPIARVKVLIEILEDRTAALRADRGQRDEHVQRLDRGLSEMSDDVAEIEALIADLLTSGRLELRGDAGVLRREPVAAAELLARCADKVGAQAIAHDVDTLHVDAMLIERLLSNLLANARRACPDGEITVELVDRGDAIVLSVEDEGSGVAPQDRQAIFEAFTRLDAARDRDRGGVGLGLYLCRQIARAHGGDIEVQDRLDGAPGARFVVTLPPHAR